MLLTWSHIYIAIISLLSSSSSALFRLSVLASGIATVLYLHDNVLGSLGGCVHGSWGWDDLNDSISRLALNRNFELPGKRHGIDLARCLAQ